MMMSMILDGCKDLDEAKRKVREILNGQNGDTSAGEVK